MFDCVPQGDAIFMKGVLVSYSDEDCKKVLENCHNALPENGKFILCDTVMPEETDDSERTRMLQVFELLPMTFHAAKCKSRTESEYRKLCEAAGFTSFRALYNFDHFAALKECQK
ncbi:nicotinate N-methyltransferase 1-like [Nymphaea colorata]|nr:nicotinate N-methyltransferase 1-like [Nymphaea colorata]